LLFNSLQFLVFFVVVYAIYLALHRHRKAQNVWLLAASMFFYGYWDWRFLGLIAVSSSVDFITAVAIHRSIDPRRRKLLLIVSVIFNLTVLGFFKYFHFFDDSLTAILRGLGLTVHPSTLQVALPIGISFYTFQAMSYVIDVYRRKIEPCRSAIDYALFIAFFPHLVAGPIQVPWVLLPQVMKPRRVNWPQVNDGLFLIVWGLFKKMVIADNLAIIANGVFDHYGEHQGIDTLVGALAFTFQIYGDFSGYSDIARGLSKLLGFELLINFKLPYFAINPTDFWLRWHISLSTWLRDYLYIPLGGNRGGSFKTYRNLALTMLLGGLWHGASWNFVLWGAYHGVLLIAYRAIDRNPEHEDPWSGRYSYWRIIAKMALMFAFTVIGWIVFRSHSVDQIVQMVLRIGWSTSTETKGLVQRLAFFVAPLIVMQVWQYKARDLLVMAKQRPVILGLAYGLAVAWMFIFGVRESLEFIYFQF
jgi:D-alanyl-lipoteichoic acid acyltransferase DltB (MBOAT superfamily)